MALVTFQDLPSTTTPINSSNLNNNFTECNNIVASGSNANGSYIKYSDGTMVQTGTGQCAGNVGYADITFPVAFYDTNYIMLANHKYTGGSGYGGSGQLRNITNPQANNTTTGYIYSYLYDGSVADYPRKVQYIAIGKWK